MINIWCCDLCAYVCTQCELQTWGVVNPKNKNKKISALVERGDRILPPYLPWWDNGEIGSLVMLSDQTLVSNL